MISKFIMKHNLHDEIKVQSDIAIVGLRVAYHQAHNLLVLTQYTIKKSNAPQCFDLVSLDTWDAGYVG